MTLATTDVGIETPAAPLVSVVVTAYNQAGFVRQALESVLAQRYGAVELVVVDDGSTDATRSVIEEVLAGTAAARMIAQEHAGQAAALNAGIAAASGTYVALLDGDDYWAPEKLAAMVALMAAHPDGGVYQHQVAYSSGGLFREVLPNGDIFTQWQRNSPLNLLIHPELVKVNVPTSGLCFRREVLEKLLPIPEALVVCPDYYLFVLGCADGPLYSLPQPLATWRDHPENAGKQDRFSFHGYWRPVVLPVVNAALRERGHDLELVFRRSAILWEPFRLLRAIWRRRG